MSVCVWVYMCIWKSIWMLRTHKHTQLNFMTLSIYSQIIFHKKWHQMDSNFIIFPYKNYVAKQTFVLIRYFLIFHPFCGIEIHLVSFVDNFASELLKENFHFRCAVESQSNFKIIHTLTDTHAELVVKWRQTLAHDVTHDYIQFPSFAIRKFLHLKFTEKY